MTTVADNNEYVLSALHPQIDLSELDVPEIVLETTRLLEEYLDRGCQDAPGSNNVPAKRLVVLLEDFIQGDLRAKVEKANLFLDKTHKAYLDETYKVYAVKGEHLHATHYFRLMGDIMLSITRLDLFDARIQTAVRLYRLSCLI